MKHHRKLITLGKEQDALALSGTISVITGQPRQLLVGPKIMSVAQSSLGNYAISLWEDYLNTQTSNVHGLEKLVFKSECSHSHGVVKDIWLFSIYKQIIQLQLSPRLRATLFMNMIIFIKTYLQNSSVVKKLWLSL